MSPARSMAADAPSEASFPSAGRRLRLSEDGIRWAFCFALVLALHGASALYILFPKAELADGSASDAIVVDLLPPSEDAEKPDEVAGLSVPETAAATNSQPQAEDPDPPAPEAPAPTVAERKPNKATPETLLPPLPSDPEAWLPPKTETEPKPEDRQPDPEQPVEDARHDVVENQSAPSRASAGSAAILSGGRRASNAAQATWRGAIGKHLAHNRRFPTEARARGLQGMARVRVTIDADGHVLSRALVRSAGNPLLDDEALALMERCDPFPKPPPGTGTPVALTIPVKFTIK